MHRPGSNRHTARGFFLEIKARLSRRPVRRSFSEAGTLGEGGRRNGTPRHYRVLHEPGIGRRLRKTHPTRQPHGRRVIGSSPLPRYPAFTIRAKNRSAFPVKPGRFGPRSSREGRARDFRRGVLGCGIFIPQSSRSVVWLRFDRLLTLLAAGPCLERSARSDFPQSRAPPPPKPARTRNRSERTEVQGRPPPANERRP